MILSTGPCDRSTNIVVLMSAFTLMAQLEAAILNPSSVLPAKNLHVTVEQVIYTTTVFVLFSGVLPALCHTFRKCIRQKAALSHPHTCRHIGFVGSAAAPTCGGEISRRVFTGIVFSIPLEIGAA